MTIVCFAVIALVAACVVTAVTGSFPLFTLLAAAIVAVGLNKAFTTSTN